MEGALRVGQGAAVAVALPRGLLRLRCCGAWRDRSAAALERRLVVEVRVGSFVALRVLHLLERHGRLRRRRVHVLKVHHVRLIQRENVGLLHLGGCLFGRHGRVGGHLRVVLAEGVALRRDHKHVPRVRHRAGVRARFRLRERLVLRVSQLVDHLARVRLRDAVVALTTGQRDLSLALALLEEVGVLLDQG